MAEHTFECKDKGTEYPGRFGGHEVRYAIVEAGETPEATLASFLEGFVDPAATPADQAVVLADYLNGYGLTYRRNGIVKRVLNSDDVAKLTVEEALAAATKAANEDRLGAPKATSSKKGTSKKVAEAERDRDNAVEMARAMFLGMNASLRKQFRPQLVEKFGEDTVAGWEQE